MDFDIGNINELTVDRKTDIGYMLFNDYDDEIFLHNNQVKGDIYPGDVVNAFVFYDSKKRLSATMEVPIITIDNPGFVTVKNVVSSLGVFIENNIVKDPLISADDLPEHNEKWPKVGDVIFCKLKTTSTQLIARLVSPKEINDFLTPTTRLNRNKKVEAIVIKSGDEGVNLITKEGHNIFVFHKHKRKNYRIGEVAIVTITNIKDEIYYNGSLIENKVSMMDSDSKALLDYLESNSNFMPFNTKSNIDDIKEVFNMSKASFKRALSHLYKQRLIEIKEEGTYLIK